MHTTLYVGIFEHTVADRLFGFRRDPRLANKRAVEKSAD